MDRLISEFTDYLKLEKRRSEHTVESYKADLEAFRDYVVSLDEELSWQTVDADIVRSWMEGMMDRGNAATSVNRRLSALRSFYRFAVTRGKVSEDPAYHVRGPKKGKPLPQYLREEEMDRLLDGGFWDGSFEDVRSRTIVLTFYSTGIRLSELTGLDDVSIDYALHQMKVLGKRSKERVIPFGQELETTLRAYQALRDERFGIPAGALFVNDKGARMSSQQVRNDVRRSLSKVSTMKKRSPHVLRHTFATAMLDNGSDLESVRKLLGHESVATTEIYTHTTFEQLRRVYRIAHPRGGNSGTTVCKDENGHEKTTGE